MTRALAVVGLLTLFAAALPARVSIVLDVSSLVGEAELIVFGDITSVKSTGAGSIAEGGKSWPVSFMSATVRVKDTLKGDPGPILLEIDFTHNNNPVGNGPLEATAYPGSPILFLKRYGTRYRFADDVYGSVRIPPTCTSPAVVANSSVYARVITIMGCPLLSLKATEQERMEAFQALNTEESAEVKDLFVAALDEGGIKAVPGLRGNLIAALLRAHYAPALALAEQELFSGQPTTENNGRLNIILGLQSVSATQSVPLLARALKLPEDQLREASAQALENTGAGGIDALLGSIDDTDPEVQFYVMQIFRIFDGQPVLSSARHRTRRVLE